MKFFYILSILYLILMFLLYKKKGTKICVFSSIIYSICLLFCYNTFIVFFLYLLGIQGSLLIFSIINFIIGTLIGVIIFIKDKSIQKYYFDKKKFFVLLCLGIIIFLVGYFRFRGYETISYESGDSAVHYRHALIFSEELSILDKNNSNDLVFNEFVRIMPISYVNAGILMNLFSGVKSYVIFHYYNVVCLIITSLLFFITVFECFKFEKKDYISGLIFTLFYILAFPLNSFLFGFCYLSLSLMVINLLYFTIVKLKDKFDSNIITNIIIVGLITFSVFYSYYLFVPAVYFALGIYYIYLWKKKNINFKELLLYGIFTLIIPFIVGFSYFLIPSFMKNGVGVVGKVMNTWGYSYDNITPMYLLFFVLGYLLFDFIKKKGNFNYLKLNLCIISGYISLFLVCYIFRYTDLYYFYKLFYLYWFFVVLFFGKKFYIRFKKYFYFLMIVLLGINIYVYNFSDSRLSSMFVKTNIYTWNTNLFKRDKLLFDEDEVNLLERSCEFKKLCQVDNVFLVVGGNPAKNIWFYSATDYIPIAYFVNGEGAAQLYDLAISSLSSFDKLSEHDCAIYYYEDNGQEIEKKEFEVLYQNESGAIIKKK